MLTEADVYGAMRRECSAAGGVKQWAILHGISPGYAAEVMGGRTPPGPAVLKALGFVRVVRYVDTRNGGEKHG